MPKTKSLIPADAVRRTDNHLAEGEVTGHFHDATGEGIAVLSRPGDDTSLWLDAPNGAVVTHQEHNPVTLPAGVFERRIVQEYDHVAEEARAVVD